MERSATIGRANAILKRQRGVSLVVCLVMLVPVLLLGVSATQLSLQGEKATRNDRDYQIAFQAAEAALVDAEMDIEKSPDAGQSRSALFSENSQHVFVENCGAGLDSNNLGLCAHRIEGAAPAWLAVDFLDASADSARTVPYGRFTGKAFPVGEGALPGRLPRYIVEALIYNRPGELAEGSGQTHFYGITALGFGARDTTRVMLQTFYRKGS
jgi:type IV pilus assembly protein PilX